jgi:hypothetical protein
MTTRTTIRSWPAMALAGIFVGGTSFVLFNDLLEGARVTTGHVLTALALIAATAAGHQIVKTFRDRRYFNGLGMVLLTAAALAYVATMSGARNAEQAALKAERIDGSNSERERIVKLRSEAQAMLSGALKDVARKCEGGDGKACKGAKATRDVYDAAVKGHNADLSRLGNSQTPNAGYKAAAEAIVLIPWFHDRAQADVEKALIVLLPWLAVLIAELGTIVFLSSALGHRSVSSFSDSVQTSFSTTKADDVLKLFADPLPENDPEPPKPRKTKKPTNVVRFPTVKHPVLQVLETSGRTMSNGELAKAMRVSDSEASKRWQEVSEQLEMGWNGKFRTIGLKAWKATA